MTAPFDAQALTASLQEAVRLHDRRMLEQLVADDFMFSSTRVDHEIDRAAWIDWACATEWVSFDLGPIRTIDRERTQFVEFVVAQAIAGQNPTSTRWLVTDLWTDDGSRWRLAGRHPELWTTPRT